MTLVALFDDVGNCSPAEVELKILTATGQSMLHIGPYKFRASAVLKDYPYTRNFCVDPGIFGSAKHIKAETMCELVAHNLTNV